LQPLGQQQASKYMGTYFKTSKSKLNWASNK